MDKKYADAFEAFQQCRFEDCLRQLDQIFKKMQKGDGKKKNQLSDKQIQNLQMIKAGSLAATGEIHQSNALLKSQFPHPIISEDMSFLFLQICSMGMDDRLCNFTVRIDEGRDKMKIDINRFLLLNRKFEVLSRIFLRQYMTQKKHQDALAQIYLQYLKQIQSFAVLNYSRNPVIKQIPANLKMVSMFLNKFLSTFNSKQNFQNDAQASARHKKLKTSVSDLLIKISIHEGNSQMTRTLFTEWHESLGVNKFTHLRSLIEMKNQKEQNLLLWTKTYLSIFHSNLQLDKYEPVYYYSIEFIDGLIGEKNIDLSSLKEPTQIQIQDVYKYLIDPIEQFQNYYNSLFTEYRELISKKENKMKDFYRISLKNVLLILLNISTRAGHNLFAEQILLCYKSNFGKTLTFCSEIHQYLKNGKISTQFLQQKLKPICEEWTKADDRLIWFINEERIFARQLGGDPFLEWGRLVDLYQNNVNEIEKLRPLQKGQRYLSDQFITIAADSVRHYIQTKKQLTQEECEEIFFYILSILEKAIGRSPYNFDLKLRAIYFMEKLGYFEQIIQMLDTNDIKAVQFDTLGFFYLKQIIHYSLFETNEGLLVRMVRSYQQNFRESSEYGFKALKAGSLNQCSENLCYNDQINRSYNLCILLYTLYLKNRGRPDAQFYLEEILQRLETKKGINFNCDFRVMRNVIDWEGKDFSDFYGIFNSQKILKNQCLLKKVICQINLKKVFQENLESLKQIRCDWKLKQIYDFEGFNFFERSIKGANGEGESHHERQNELLLYLYNKIVELKLSVIKFCQEIAENKEIKESMCQILKKIKEIKEYIVGNSCRNKIKLLPFVRQHYTEIIGLVVGINESFLGKNKKKVEGKAEKKESCSDLINGLIQSVSDEIQLTENNFGQRKWKNQVMHQRDEVLRRMTSMNHQEFKKIYKIKL